MAHISVLMNEVIDGLNIQSDDVVIDATINGGGHSFEIAQRLGNDGVLIGIDQDQAGLDVSAQRLETVQPTIHLVHDNFRNLDQVLDGLNIQNYDKILFDLGWSSNQFENPTRGFSFMHDGPLSMVLADDPTRVSFTAYDIVNDWDEEHIIDILKGYGEEQYSKRIAQAIVQARSVQSIESTVELAEIVKKAVPKKYQNGSIHSATKTFQALRIAVNDEIGALNDGLEKAWHYLKSGGRIVVISFHSIEDRIVKNFFRNKKQSGVGILVTKKPITASQQELTENNRARSAKLRIIEKL